MEKVYFAARWDKGTADYINCPFTKEEYDAFIDALDHRRDVRPESRKASRAENASRSSTTSKAACPSKRPPAAAATPCASAP